MANLESRLRSVRESVAQAAAAAGRNPGEVTLVAVSKTHPVEAIREAYRLGQRDFGESRWQELEAKAAELPGDIRWHFIGHLQSNKAKRVGALAWLIHTLSTESQLREFAKLEVPVRCLVEVNIAAEPQKSGVLPDGLDDFLERAAREPIVQIEGLMTMGPALADPEGMRPYFRRLAQLLDKTPGKCASMGMSSDYAVAIQEGSTLVRVGTAIFGSRP